MGHISFGFIIPAEEETPGDILSSYGLVEHLINNFITTFRKEDNLVLHVGLHDSANSQFQGLLQVIERAATSRRPRLTRRLRRFLQFDIAKPHACSAAPSSAIRRK